MSDHLFATGSDSQVLEAVSTEEEVARDKMWNVIVLNDPVNLMSYVIMVFRRIFGISGEKAKQHMLEVHNLGRTTLWTGHREKAENYVYTLQQWQLNAIIEENDA